MKSFSFYAEDLRRLDFVPKRVFAITVNFIVKDDIMVHISKHVQKSSFSTKTAILQIHDDNDDLRREIDDERAIILELNTNLNCHMV